MNPPTPEPEAPAAQVDFKIAGAPAVATPGQIAVRFHPIPPPLWNCIIGFHRAVSIKYRGESVSYHRWHAASGTYHSLIPHQKTSRGGLSVRVDWKDERNIQLLNEYGRVHGEEFFPACTIHTHVDIAAFESGTDASDEEEQPGWHITLGKLLSHKRYDLDFRMRIPKTKRLKELVNTNRKFNLAWDHLFLPSSNESDFIFTTPGTTDWEQFIERVQP